MSRASQLNQIVRTLMRVMLVSERTSPEHQHAVRYNPSDFHVLAMLRADSGLRASVVADRLGVAPTTASSIIARMVRQGILRREKSSQDGRAVALSLTDHGRVLADAIHNQDLSNMQLFLSSMSEEEQDELIRLLGKVSDRVKGLEENGR